VLLVALGSMLVDGGGFIRQVAAGMRSHALAAVKDLDRGQRRADLHHLPGQHVGDAVVVEVDLDVILAARRGEAWYYYAAAATLGSVIGAYFTFRIARTAGSAYLGTKFGKRRVAVILKYFERWGTGTLILSLPFPTTTASASIPTSRTSSSSCANCR